jgi:hypothetical protein
LFFENDTCTNCNSRLGYSVEAARLVTLPEGALEADFAISSEGAARYRVCRNYSEHSACNWLVCLETTAEANRATPMYCRSCALTEIIPDLSDAGNKTAWAEVESAKRRLLYTLYSLDLPVTPRAEDPECGLAFRFLQSTPEQQVMTGHEGGVITLNIAEANASFRENLREKLGEAYRTVLGHLRHEIGHYYWDRLIKDGAELQPFRTLFGDEQADYQAAIQRHYDQGPPHDWSTSFISAYATMHPWEDWAETWAHYLHMLDTLETAKSHGLTVRVPGERPTRVATDALVPNDFEGLVTGWHAVTLTLNSLSRSIGVKDVYPFVLSQPVLEKLHFIHRVIRGRVALLKADSAAGGAKVPSGPSPVTSQPGTKGRGAPVRARPDE